MSMVPLEVHTLGDLDRSPALPVEVIERVVDFLHDDIHTLAVCSLICRALLPTTRKHIWSSVHIPVLHDRRPKTRRLAGFLALLDSNPDLPPYVRSLTWAWAASGGSTPAWSGFKRYRLWEKLPNVRALKFHRIAFFVIDPILELCRMFPCLEELVLDRVSAVAVGILRTSTQDQATYGTRKLKQLSISGAMSPRHVSALSEALLEEQLHSSLEILDLRCATYLSCRLGLYPSAKALPLLLTELAPHLRSCGIPIYSAEYNADSVARLYDCVMQCTNLRSLLVQCDTRPDPATRVTLHDTPFLFVEALAARLSYRGPPLPQLEEVSMWWFQTEQDPPGCLEAFKYLALALVGDRSRFPALKRVEIRRSRSTYPSRDDGEPNVYLSEEMLRRGLSVVEEANVELLLFL